MDTRTAPQPPAPRTDRTTTPTTPAGPVRHRRLRRTLAAVAVTACLPYLTLKVLWLAGVTVGLHDPAIAHDPVMRAANLATLGLDVAAILLALALAGRAARRLPRMVLDVPMFVATGLLGGIVVALPVQGLLTLVSPPASRAAGTAVAAEPIAAWVYAMVYGGFGVLGLSLLALFALHTREHRLVPAGWTTPGRTVATTASATPGRLRALAALLAAAGVAETLVLAARTGAAGVGALQVVGLVATVLAAGGLVRLVSPGPRRRPWLALAAAYGGAAVVAAWGLYAAVLLVVPNPLRGDGPVPPALVGLEIIRLVLGVVTAVALRRLRPAGER